MTVQASPGDSIPSDLFLEALGDNPAAVSVRIDSLMISLANRRAVVPVQGLDIERFATMGLCELKVAESPRPDFYRYWGGEEDDRLLTSFQQVVWHVQWFDQRLLVAELSWQTGCGGESRTWVMADTVEVAEAFILEVERKTHAPGHAILVFSNGQWRRSEALYKATQSASFDDLVLDEELKSAIRNDFQSFLHSEARYQRLGIAWRRGALMIGPPGNGKTHCVRALVKELGIPSLYVQSLSHHYYTAEQLWEQVFKKARKLRPCVLVLEDLDSLVDPSNRSYFLNQLDGFERNHGLIVLATTNYPERIDAAIIERPSRFDRKYHFSLPTVEERAMFLSHWQAKVTSETGWREDQIASIAEAADGFSFAYLKELVISSVMKWLQDTSTPFANVAHGQVELLRRQMKTESPSTE